MPGHDHARSDALVYSDYECLLPGDIADAVLYIALMYGGLQLPIILPLVFLHRRFTWESDDARLVRQILRFQMMVT